MQPRWLFAAVELVVLVSLMGLLVDRYELRANISSLAIADASTISFYWNKNTTKSGAQNATSRNNSSANVLHQASERNRTITMIVNLHGELANNLGFLLQAYALKFELEEQLPHVRIDIQGEHMSHFKWRRPGAEIPMCFPNLATLNFEGGRWDTTGEYAKRSADMIAWLQLEPNMPPNAVEWILNGHIWNPDTTDRSQNIITNTSAVIQASVHLLQRLLDQQTQEPSKMHIQEPTNANISLPFLHTTHMQYEGAIIGKWHSRLLEVFKINQTACCNHLAEDDEIVFHFRNFWREGPRLPSMGFVELHSSRIGEWIKDQISQWHIPTNKVAVITRFYDATVEDDPKGWKPVLQSMEAAGLQARIVPQQSGPEDYCLLTKAKYVMGYMVSTFVRMAGVMGNATHTVLYLVDTPPTRGRFPAYFWFTPEELWPNSTVLQQRFHYVFLPEKFGREQ